MDKQRLALVVTAGVGLLAVLAPWVSYGPLDFLGIKSVYGLLTALGFLTLGLSSWLGNRRQSLTGLQRWLGVVGSGFALVFTLIGLFTVRGEVIGDDSALQMLLVGNLFHLGYGIFLAMVAALIALTLGAFYRLLPSRFTGRPPKGKTEPSDESNPSDD